PRKWGEVMRAFSWRVFGLCVGVIFCLLPAGLSAQNNQKNPKDLASQSEAPGLSDKDKAKQKESLKQELSGAYKRWTAEEGRHIIHDEERKVLKTPANDEERKQFIEQFWLRRNPDPESLPNDFKEEHYRRIAYANQHFASGIPGWKTDRGRIYIMYGPADEIDAHPSGGHYDRPAEEGG